MRVEHFTDWGETGLGAAGWDRLVAGSRFPVPFLGWQFQTTWWRAFGPKTLHLLGVQDGAGDWAGALPLFETTGPEGPVLRLVGGTDVADYLDLVALAGREEEVWKALLPVLIDLPVPRLDLRPVPAVSPTALLLPLLAGASGFVCRRELEDRCPVVELPASWDAYLATLGSKDRHELRRKLRRVEAAAPRVEVARTPAEVSPAMDEFLLLHRKSKVGKAKFMDESMEVFFRDIGTRFAEAGTLALWTLHLEGRPAASLVCLEYGDTIGLYNSGFDPEARALSPGVVLIARTIEDAITRGFRRYDFLRGEEPYKYGFGATPTEVVRVTVERA
jgi:CelD/BcsL family acetyltransferase involved in cellulose biosynthesis